MTIKSIFAKLFVRDRKREERLKALSDILEHGTEDQYWELLVSWGVPQDELESLLNEFRRQRRAKRGLLQ
jgi:hypothetical protein